MTKKIKTGCEFENECDCGDKDKIDQCEKCSFYYMIDSGFGYCRVFPETKKVAWCRNVCGRYKRRLC